MGTSFRTGDVLGVSYLTRCGRADPFAAAKVAGATAAGSHGAEPARWRALTHAEPSRPGPSPDPGR